MKNAPQFRWTAPPTWPQPPTGWHPPAGWTPDPAWGPAPDGWQFWQPADVVSNARPLYRKKRVLIPASLVGLLLFAGAVGGSGTGGNVTAIRQAAAEQAAADEAAAEKVAAEKAAAEKVAAEKAAADKAAAEKAAADKAVAEKAAADKAAAEKAAADKAEADKAAAAQAAATARKPVLDDAARSACAVFAANWQDVATKQDRSNLARGVNAYARGSSEPKIVEGGEWLTDAVDSWTGFMWDGAVGNFASVCIDGGYK